MSHIARKPFSGFPTRSDTNRAVQPQKMARGLKFRKYEVEAKTKVLISCADLRLCFRICKIWFSHDAAHITVSLLV